MLRGSEFHGVVVASVWAASRYGFGSYGPRFGGGGALNCPMSGLQNLESRSPNLGP